jgi:spermidine synthase
MALVFSGYELMEIVPSRYAELCVTRNRETVSVFAGGARLFSYPDQEEVGERIHIPLLAHAHPGSVLLIGGGQGGGVSEALNHPSVKNVDWIELDGNLIAAVALSAGSSKGRILTGDGRFMIGSSGLYDVIIVTVPEPVNLRWNRYFTVEFFESARRSLFPGGILTIRHSSSENFISAGNAAVLGIIRETLASSFEYVDLVPGGTVYFIASDSPIDSGAIPARLLERGLGGLFLSLDELVWRLSDERREHLASALENVPHLINTDLHPVLVSRELILYGRRSRSFSADFIEGMLGLPSWALPAAFLAAAILLASLTRGGAAAKSAIFLTGACSMTVQISLMFAYQAFSGILYHSLVVFTALFMAGAALGAYLSGIQKGRRGSSLVVFHILMAFTAIIVPVWLRLQAEGLSGQLVGAAGFMFLSMTGGLLTGAYYRTVVETAWPESGGSPPALFYSWDMFGACAGGLLAGTFLIPLSGLVWTAAAVAAIHLASALLLARKIMPVR